MRVSILAGAFAAALWGDSARAQTSSNPTPQPPIPPDTLQTERATTTTTPQPTAPPPEPAARPAYTQPAEPVYVDDERDKMRGVTLMLGGGVEGYTGELAPQVNPGPSWGVTAALKPTKVLGIEIGYSGAANELKGHLVAGMEGRGADIIRNGVDARATLALTATPVQPYILGGFGINHYRVRDELRAVGFQSDTSERIPLGGGLRSHFGQFTADARFNYNILINEGFAQTVAPNNVLVSSVSAGAYQGLLQLGATF